MLRFISVLLTLATVLLVLANICGVQADQLSQATISYEIRSLVNAVRN